MAGITPFLLALVRSRAEDTCEYCRLPQMASTLRFEIDHIRARQHGGATTAENLALCCPRCNGYKGPNIAGIDPVSDNLTRLFDPRNDCWDDHFGWFDVQVVGRTPIGRTTIVVLNMNDPGTLDQRRRLRLEGLFPPPRQKA